MMRTDRRLIALSLIASAGLAAQASAQSATLIGLQPRIDNLTNTAARGISGDGSTIAGDVGGRPWIYDFSAEAAGDPALLYLTAVDEGKTTASLARSTRASVGIGIGLSGLAGWRWNEAEGVVNMGCDGGSPPPLGPGGPSLVSCVNEDISGDGSIIVGVMNQDPSAGTAEAFRWTALTGRVSLGFLPGETDGTSWARAVSADGSTIVGHAGYPASPSQLAVMWDGAGTPTLLGVISPDGIESEAHEVNHDGSIVVGDGDVIPPLGAGVDSLWDAWIWHAGDEEPTSIGHVITDIPMPQGVPAGSVILDDVSYCRHVPTGLTDDGSTVIGVATGQRFITVQTDRGSAQYGVGIEIAWIWDQANGMRLLGDALANEYGVDTSAWDFNTRSRAEDITPDGSALVGVAKKSGSNDDEGFLVRIGAPCPADLNGNGSAEVFDLLDYLALWFNMDAAAERTGDSPAAIDVFDLLAYLDDWFTGC